MKIISTSTFTPSDVFPMSPRAAEKEKNPGFNLLLACTVLSALALTMTACKTTTGNDTGNLQVATTAPVPASESEDAAWALFNKGRLLLQQGKTQEAISALDELDHRFGQDTRHPIRTLMAQALSLKAQTADTPTETLAAYEEIDRRYSDEINTDAALQKQLADSLFVQADKLTKEGHPAAAIPIYAEIERRSGDINKSWAARAIFQQADNQRQLRNNKAAVNAFDRLDHRFGQERDPEIRKLTATALLQKGDILGRQDDVRMAIDTYEEIDRRFAEDKDVSLRQLAVKALFSKGELVGKRGTAPSDSANPVAAVAVYDDIVQRFGKDRDPGIRNAVGNILLKKSETLRIAGDRQGTIAAYDEIIKRFGKDNAPDARVWVATALFRKGRALEQDNIGAANAAFDEITQRFASDTHPDVRKIVNGAMSAKLRLAPGATTPDTESISTNPHLPQHDN